MKTLEKFYKEKIYIKGMKPFKELKDWQKDRMRNSFVFDMFRFKNSMKELKETVPFTFIITWVFIIAISILFAVSFAIGFKQIFGW